MSHRRAALLTQVILGVVAAGCATAPGKGRSVDIEQTMVDLRAQNAGYVRRIEELQNRIFILEDQLSSRRKAEGRRSAPASKRLGATSSERAAPAASEIASDDEASVEYAGDAALPQKRGHARPLLQLAATGHSAATVTMGPAPSPEPALSPGSANPEALSLYRQSVDALHAGRNGAALTGFRKFLARYPHHDFADNAQYWVGECYYDLNQFHAAAREFRRVVERYPRGNKVPDAMLKLGLSQLASGDRRDGRQMLESLRRSYPKHAAAQLASARLRQGDESPARPTVSLEMSGR